MYAHGKSAFKRIIGDIAWLMICGVIGLIIYALALFIVNNKNTAMSSLQSWLNHDMFNGVTPADIVFVIAWIVSVIIYVLFMRMAIMAVAMGSIGGVISVVLTCLIALIFAVPMMLTVQFTFHGYGGLIVLCVSILWEIVCVPLMMAFHVGLN